MTSADFSRADAREISPGNCTLLHRTAAEFTSTGIPDDFVVLCQLIAPCRPSIRFFSISSRFSPSLPSPRRSPAPELASDGGFFIFMFWYFHKGLEPHLQRAHAGHTQFGFITTNSIHQTFNRRVIESFLADTKKPFHLAYAIADHPWVDSADGAAVRIAMTVAAPGKAEGILEKVITEQAREDGENEVTLLRSGGTLAANFQIGADTTTVNALESNRKLSAMGVKLHGKGFLLDQKMADELRPQESDSPMLIFRYVGSRGLVQDDKELFAIDAFGLSESQLRTQSPEIYQHLFGHVKPERDQNRRDNYRLNWWIYGEPRATFRPALVGLKRMLCTPRTAKHRIFLFLDLPVVAESEVVCIACDDAYVLAILASTIHTVWALELGGRMGMGNDPRYNNSRCFDTFPFPALEEGSLKQRIRSLGERLDSHRKRQQEQYPGLTLTGIYNVLEKLRSGEPLTAKEKQIHDQGLVTVLRQIHDELDAAVLEAYGWRDLRSRDIPVANMEAPHSCGASECAAIEKREALPNGVPFAPRQECRGSLKDKLLTRLVALNHERAAEEKHGLIRWLRPEYQNPTKASAANSDGHRPPLQGDLAGIETSSPSKIQNQQSSIDNPSSSFQWPDRLPDQVAILRKLITTGDRNVAAPYGAEALSGLFGRKNKKRTEQIEGILETLKGLGQL